MTFFLISLLAASVPGTQSVGGDTLTLNGVGMREATIFKVDVYEAALYLKSKSSDPDEILKRNEPWRLTIRMVRDVSAEDMREAFVESFDKLGVSDTTSARYFVSQVQDSTKGQRLVVTFDPRTGLEIKWGKGAGRTLENPDFNLLRVWLGEYPPDEGLKRGLLGLK